MAYSAAGLNCMIPSMGSTPALWFYKSNDPYTDVDAAGYFSDGGERGMKDNDIVIVVDEDTATTTLHHVTGVTNGAATISANTDLTAA